MSFHIGRESSKLWKRFCAETITEINFLAENWKYILGGLIFQWTFHPFILKSKKIYTVLIWCRVLAFLVVIAILIPLLTSSLSWL